MTWPPADSSEARELREQLAADDTATRGVQPDPPAPTMQSTAAAKPEPVRREWCGHCDQRTRLAELDDGRLIRCPQCHPLTAKVTR